MNLLSNYNQLDSEEEKYEFLIELGDILSKLTEEQKINQNRIIGCQNRVWIVVSKNNSKFCIQGESDSRLVSGLIAVVKDIFDNKTSQEIALISDNWLIDNQFKLSMTRQKGLASIVSRVRHQTQD